MKLKYKIFLAIMLTISLYLLIALNEGVHAVPLAISVSTTNATVGDSVKVTITSEYTGRINLSANGGTLSESSFWIEKNSHTVTLQASNAGKVSITANPGEGTLANADGVDVPVTAQGASVTFAAKQTPSSNENPPPTTNETPDTNTKPEETKKSSNANLKNLGIKPNDFKGFKAGTTTYSVTVPNDVDKVNVYATVQDSKASLTGTGDKKLNVGANKLDVVVTAEDGTKKTYTINVTRQEMEETTENTTPDESTTGEQNTETDDESQEEQTEQEGESDESNISEGSLSKLEIAGFTLNPKFSPTVYNYTVNVNEDIRELDITTEGVNRNVDIEVVGNKELHEGENVITILVYNAETKENATYQIIVNKSNGQSDSVNETINEAVAKANKIRLIVIGVIIFIVVGIVVFVIAARKYKAKKAGDLYEYDEEDADKFEYEDEETEEKSIENEDDDDEYKEENLDKDENEEKEESIGRKFGFYDDDDDIDESEQTKVTTIANSIIEEEIPKGLRKQRDNQYNDMSIKRTKKKGKHF